MDNNEPTIIAEDTGSIWDNDSLMIPTRQQVQDDKKDVKKDDVKVTPADEDADETDNNVEYVPNPGEYVPNDYSFEVTTYDDEGKNPKSHKISSIDEWDAFIEGDPNLGSTVALTKAMRLANKMEINSERDRQEWQKLKDDYESVSKADTDRVQTLQTWSSEMDYLVNRGDLPAIANEYKDANWSDPEVAKQDGVKEQIALLKFMDKENKARGKAGLRQITSVIDALNAFKLDQAGKAPEAPSDGDIRKAAGARVAGGSPNPSGATNAPKGIAVGRGGSLNDLGSGW